MPIPHLREGFNAELAYSLGQLIGAVTKVTQSPVAEEDTPDTLGIIGYAQRKLRDHVAQLKSELPMDRDTTYEGASYDITPSNKATRTYNSARLLSDLGQTGEPFTSTLLRLIALDVVRMEWQWTKLKAEAARSGIGLVVDTNMEITPDRSTLDDPHVGEKWTTSISLQGRQKDPSPEDGFDVGEWERGQL